MRGVLIRGFLAFVLTATNLQIWNIQDRSNPTLYGSSVSFPFAATAAPNNALACRQNTLYVISQTPFALTSYLLIIAPS